MNCVTRLTNFQEGKELYDKSNFNCRIEEILHKNSNFQQMKMSFCKPLAEVHAGTV